MSKKKPSRVCFDCIHFWPCSTWNIGTLRNADASHCEYYETLEQSNAYYLGRMEGIRETEAKYERVDKDNFI